MPDVDDMTSSTTPSRFGAGGGALPNPGRSAADELSAVTLDELTLIEAKLRVGLVMVA